MAAEGVGRLGGRGFSLATKEAPVPHSEAARSIHSHSILVVLEHLHDQFSFVPLRWVTTCLILDEDTVTATKGGKAVGVLVPACSAECLSMGSGLLHLVEL